MVLVGCVSKPLNLKETPITQMTQSPLWAATALVVPPKLRNDGVLMTQSPTREQAGNT